MVPVFTHFPETLTDMTHTERYDIGNGDERREFFQGAPSLLILLEKNRFHTYTFLCLSLHIDRMHRQRCTNTAADGSLTGISRKQPILSGKHLKYRVNRLKSPLSQNM